ncbi:MAG: SDR family NAD(P)-dependent oxidoreductase, partial [Thermodesulfobacteriota bacterium]
MDCFKGKVAIVTGGASGIGRTVCEALGNYGATTVVADINLEGAQEVSKVISGNGGAASAAGLDVREAEAIEKLIDKTVAEHGRLDYMFNNAGIANLGEVRD